MKLVPGARVEVMQGIPANNFQVVVRDARSIKERRFVPHGHQALVIGVENQNPNGSLSDYYVCCFSPEHGFWRCGSAKLRVIWSPENT